MKKRIALLLCLAMLAGLLAGCDVSIDSILSIFSKPEATKTETGLAAVRKAEKGTFVMAEGVVARITYAFGQKPTGFILVDDTSSIYVYDSELAAQVKEGNKITIQAEKDYWILDSEQSNAEKFGYIGCNQLKNPILISNDEDDHAFDTSWMETTTVKKIIDTPVTTDISSKIFKATALVKKVPGDGFVNYYFFDLDGETGTYTYTQCNGSDFAWLDKFDGKICTVYLTALNAKSTASDCYWRLLPIAVLDEGFDKTTVNVPENAVKYYGVTQFLSKYTGDPALELLTTVNNELLCYSGVTLSYASSDNTVISVDGNVMNCLKSGIATITVTGTYNGVTYSEDVTIEVTIQEDNNTYATVKEAIDTTVGETVEVKGIVGPSLVNKTGFYLIDETGVIAVLTKSADVLSTLKFGNEVVLSATRTLSKSQTCLSDATVVVNNYGKHDYSTNAFKGEISVADFVKFTAPTDYTTNVYVMTATVKVVTTAYSTNVYLTDGTNEILLYAGNGKTHYGWIVELAEQKITVEIAPCDWNSKGYKGCVLAVVNPDGSKIVNTLNFN